MEAFCKSAWLGLNSYQESDSQRFFGRNEESDRLVEAIGENGLCTVFGPSGAGKTSLLLAGVFPRLRRNDCFPVYLRFDHEKGAASYVRQVVDVLDGAVRKAGFSIRETAPSVLPAADETLWEWFHRHLFLDDCLNPIRPVLMIDQFEEIFTKGLERRGAEEVQAFFSELTDLCTNNIPQAVVRAVEDGRGKLEFDHEDCNWRLVVSLREDFLPRLEEVSHDHPVFRKMRQSVSSLNREQALQAVCGPGGELVDEAVANAIVDVVGRSASGRSGRIEPALLSLFCSRLDIARQQKGLSRITPELLAASGKDILAGFYVETMGRVSNRTSELIEDHLLTSGGYRDSWAEEDAKHAGVLQSEIDTLVNARLLHVDHRGGVSWLEFSHDILTGVARASRDGRRQRRETEVLQAKLRRQRAHTRRVTGLLVALVALLAVSAAAVWHLFYREYAPCYLRAVKVFGRFQGFGESLSESDKRHVSVYFKLRHHGRYSFHPHAGIGRWFEKSPVYRMEAFDGRGQPTTQHGMGTYLWNGEDVSAKGVGADSSSKPGGAVAQIQSSDEMKKVCAWEFDYGYDGRPLHEFGVDRDGKLVWSCTYAPCADENQWRSNTVVHFVNARGFPLQQRSDNAEYVGITYDAKTGFEHRYVFYDASGKITKGRDGAECQELLLNERGLSTRLTSLAWSAADGRFTNIIDNAGNTGMWTEFLSNDMVAVSHSFGLNGEPHPLAGGVLVHRQEFDRFNRRLRFQAFDTNGNECVYDAGGWSRIENDYYENGVMRRADIYAPPGRGGIWGITNVHHAVLQYDRDGNVCSQNYYGTNDEAVVDNNGVHGARFEYETIAEKECEIKGWFLDRNGCAVANGDGVARIETAYDPNGVKSRFDLYALEGCGGIWNYTNVHQVVVLLDAYGNRTNECFYGVGGEPVAGNNNAHRTCWKFETIAGKSCEIAIWYLDENGHEAVDGNGVARMNTAYDSNGVKSRFDLYALEGCGGIWNYTNVHHVVLLLDAQGNRTNECFYGVGGEPVVGNNNAHRTCRRFETIAGKSCEVAQWYLDENDRAVADENGVAREERTYDDASGAMTRVDLYAPSDRGGIWNYENAHHVVRLYDAQGNDTNICFYGEGGEPVVGINNAHRSCYKYETIAGKSCEVAQWYLDENDRAVADENGVAQIETAYDANGTKMRVDLYAPSERGGIWNYEKVHHVVRLFDVQGNDTNQCFYGVGGEPVVGNNNAHRTCRRFETIAGKSCEVAQWYLDEDSREVADKNGVARVETTYDDASGVKSRVDLYALEGRGGIWNYEKVHHVVHLYDEQGNVTNQCLYGVDGEPVVGNDNTHSTCCKYETIAGKSCEVAQWYLDENGHPVADKEGVMRRETAYDANGNKTMVRLCDAQGNLVLVNGLYAACGWTYDERNEKVGETYFNEKMEPVRIVSVFYADEIIVGSHAAAIGVQTGDIFCEFGTYRLRDDGDFSAVKSSIREFAQKEKRLVVARKSDDGYRILAFDLPAGMMGIQIGDRQVTGLEFDKIQQVYRAYQDKGK